MYTRHLAVIYLETDGTEKFPKVSLPKRSGANQSARFIVKSSQ